MQYIPDRWIVVEILPQKLYKVIGGWQGGYLDPDSWRINSGICEVKEHKDYYEVIGYSGSSYILGKEKEGVTALTSEVFESLKNIAKDANQPPIKIVNIKDVNY